MKQFITILGFELKSYFKNKIFIGVTILLVIVSAGVMFFPALSEMLGGGTEENAAERRSCWWGRRRFRESTRKCWDSIFPRPSADIRCGSPMSRRRLSGIR